MEQNKGVTGLCKFREPTASFRNFRFAKRFPRSEISLKSVNKIRQITGDLSPDRKLDEAQKTKLIKLGASTPQILNDFANELRQKSIEIGRLSDEIRERLVISELVESLNYEDEKSIDLLKSALLIARLDNQHFNLQDYLIKADQIAAQIRTKFPENSSDHERIKILVQQLFHEMRFHGSSLDYHHRSNSYINEVMDDREGLPITLSVLLLS